MPQFPHVQNELITLLPGQVPQDLCEEAAVARSVASNYLALSMYTVGCLECLLLGGLETSQLVAAETVSFTIPKLKESTTYTICMSAMIGGREGSPTLLTAKTCEYRTTG